MAATSQSQKHAITLKGSTDIVSEFFYYGINSILYQRGIYPEGSFSRTQKYGLTLLVTADDKLNIYLQEAAQRQYSQPLNVILINSAAAIATLEYYNLCNTYVYKVVLEQVKKWLESMTVQKLVVVIKSVDTNEVLERWQFDVQCDKSNLKDGKATKDKSEKEINGEIKAVIRQITATVTFLPLIETACEFDLLVYTDKDIDVPTSWGESGPQFIANSEEVRLRSFNTLVHKVDTMVAYKAS